jgi:hypothetical protein
MTREKSMAQKVQVLLVDDVDGGEAIESVTFGLDGVTYEIDLSDKNAGKLRDGLATWVANGRRVGGRSKSGARRSVASSGGDDTAAIRAWAKKNGHKVSERGRISAAVRSAYAAR